jgi:hypothetical protein
MKKQLLATCALLVFAVPAFAQQLQWTLFREPNLKFAALFPKDPVRNEPSVEKGADGSVNSTGYMFVAATQGVYVSLAGVTDYNFAVDAERELVADRDNFVKVLNAKVTTSRRYEFRSGDEKLPALAFSAEDSTWLWKAIVVVKGNRTYMAAFGYLKGQDYASAMEKFLNSFEITK